MIVYIKEHSLITERSYTEEIVELLENEGHTALEVPDMDDEHPYTLSDFEFVDGVWRLKND